MEELEKIEGEDQEGGRCLGDEIRNVGQGDNVKSLEDEDKPLQSEIGSHESFWILTHGVSEN